MKKTYRLLILLVSALVAGAALPGCTWDRGPERLVRSLDDVAILVVDDFGYGKDPSAVKGTGTDNCAMGTNDVGSSGADDGPLPVGVSHGQTVYDVAKAALRPLETADPTAGLSYLGSPPPGGYGVAPQWWGTPRLDAWSYGGHQIALVEVHVDRYRTRDLIAGIRSVIEGMTGFERFVLNLSFVVIPCDIGYWLKLAGAGGDDALLAKYLELIKSDPDLAKLEAMLTSGSTGGFTQTLLENPDLAPFRSVTVSEFYRLFVTDVPDINGLYRQALESRQGQATPTPRAAALQQIYEDQEWQKFAIDFGLREDSRQNQRRVVPVAAAGNGIIVEGRRIRPPFPFAPGLWPGVVSVSSDGDYSNYGEVLMDGAGPAGLRGTSYAAPRLAAREAVYLFTGGPVRCDGPLPPDSTPPLKYARLTDPAPGWHNLPPADVARRHCNEEWTYHNSLS